MARFEREVLALGARIDRNLAIELQEACDRSLALGRLEAAVPRVVEAIGHPAVAFSTRATASGRTSSIYFLGSVLMHWRFDQRSVAVYFHGGDRSFEAAHLRLRYTPSLKRLADISARTERKIVTFRNGEEKALEIIRDAVCSLSSSRERADAREAARLFEESP